MQINELVDLAHTRSVNAGWYKDPITGEDYQNKWYALPVKLLLVITEIAEATEGHRRGLMDDKLPQYSMVACELADAMIRIADLAGKEGINLEEVIKAKMEFNTTRPDHQLENRSKKNGKLY